MTTDKPEVVAWLHSVRQESDVITDKVRHVWGTPLGSMAQYTVPLIRLSDYEALQAELAELKQTPLFTAGYRFGRDANDAGHTVRLQKEKDALQAECDALRDKTRLTLGVGDGTGNLFVHGDYDSIKRVQELIFECEKLRKDADRYRPLLETVLREIPHRKWERGNAPGHCHSVPGVWDEDNGALAGKECAWCKVWSEAVSAMVPPKGGDT